MTASVTASGQPKGQRYKFYLIVLVCLTPVLAGYLLFYFWRPSSFNNYGLLVQPQRYAKELALTDLQGKTVSLDEFRKRFVMITVAPTNCDATCEAQLFMTRQVRIMQGKERERVERLWVIPSTAKGGAIDPKIIAAHEDLVIARADAQQLEKLFSLPAPQNAARIEDHVYLIDYQGNLMMRFPKDPDPYKIKKDLSTLLRAASVR